MKISIRLHSSKWFFGRLQNFDLSNSSQWQALSAAIIHTAQHLLEFCWCFCATVAQKPPQKSVNTTQIQRECPWIWSCVCLRLYPYPEPKRAGGQLMRHTNVQAEDGILYLPWVCRLSKNSCRGEHCSPVPVCLWKKLTRKRRCCAKLAGDQWSPLAIQ